MNKRTSFLFLCSVIILLSGCANRNTSKVSNNDIPVSDEPDTEEIEEDDSDKFYFLDIEQYVKNMPEDEFTINSIAKNITFIPLETTDEALLQVHDFKIAKINNSYYISSGDVRWSNFSGIMEFDTVGRYIKHLMLKSYGNGPNELPRSYNWAYNINSQLLIASSWRQILSYSFENNTTNKYTLNTSSSRECLLNDGTMVSLPDWTGFSIKGNPKIPYLHFRNRECEIIHSIYYPEKRDIAFTIPENKGPVSSYQLFPHPSGDALFQDLFSDTIHRIKSMDDIKPYMVLYRGSLAPAPKDATNMARLRQLIFLSKILETKKFFFIRYSFRQESYSAIWDKQTLSFISNTKADNNDENQRLFRELYTDWNFIKYISPIGKVMLIPILNYIEGKLYSVIDAEQAMEFLPDIVFDDNPILMIIDI